MNHTQQLEGEMRKVCWIDCQRRENCGINNALAFAMNFGLPKTRDFVPYVWRSNKIWGLPDEICNIAVLCLMREIIASYYQKRNFDSLFNRP